MEITKDSTAKEVTIIRTFVRGIVARALAKRDRRERRDYGPGEGMRSPYAAGLDEKSRLSETDEDDTDNGTETLLDHLLKVSDGEIFFIWCRSPTDHMSVDIELIQDELINILIAGRDTTASCTTFAIYLLSQHPDVLKRLSEEVHSVLAAPSDAFDASDADNESPSQPPTTSPTLDNLRQMPYLRAVINETLRLFPSVPFNLRDNIAERVWVGGDGTRWYLPAGTRRVFFFSSPTQSPLKL
jgi:hypothetical protein